MLHRRRTVIDTSNAVQIFGGFGYIRGFEVEDGDVATFLGQTPRNGAAHCWFGSVREGGLLRHAADNAGDLVGEADLAVVFGRVTDLLEGVGQAPEAVGVAADAVDHQEWDPVLPRPSVAPEYGIG